MYEMCFYMLFVFCYFVLLFCILQKVHLRAQIFFLLFRASGLGYDEAFLHCLQISLFLHFLKMYVFLFYKFKFVHCFNCGMYNIIYNINTVVFTGLTWLCVDVNLV